MNKEYYSVGVSWDEKLLKNRPVPQEVKILTKEFDEYMREYNSDTFMHIKNLDWLYDKIPSGLEGKLRYKDSTWDYMHAVYFRFGMIAAVSERVKKVLEETDVSKDEYVLKPITIQGCEGPYYLMFISTISDSELIYSHSTFDGYGVEGIVQFSSYEERIKVDDIGVRNIYLPESYRSRDIIKLQSTPAVYFSKRLFDAFEMNKIKGIELTHWTGRTLNFL